MRVGRVAYAPYMQVCSFIPVASYSVSIPTDLSIKLPLFEVTTQSIALLLHLVIAFVIFVRFHFSLIVCSSSAIHLVLLFVNLSGSLGYTVC
jgi:hypothetical protein